MTDEGKSAVEHTAEVIKRHRGFLKRKAGSTSFRPKKMHRTSVDKGLRMIDNQVPEFRRGV